LFRRVGQGHALPTEAPTNAFHISENEPIVKRALVLSGGGLFGAWQAGAWRALADRMQPDLIVGASVGSLNGYAIAGGATPQELAEFWLQPASADFSKLPDTIRALMQRYPLRMGTDHSVPLATLNSNPTRQGGDFSCGTTTSGQTGLSPFVSTVDYVVVLTDLLRLKPRIFSGAEITWRHLAASCAIPGVLRPYKIDGRWYFDGGLLNPLPVWAAVELGATHIVALHALPQIPSTLLRPFVTGFRRVAGHHPPLPTRVELTLISTGDAIGSMRDALRWKRENIERWLQMGYSAAHNISLSKCYGGDCLSDPLER
jgi:NTE family protein